MPKGQLQRTLAGFRRDLKIARGQSRADLLNAIAKIEAVLGRAEPVNLDSRELLTVLAALRYWQERALDEVPAPQWEIATDGGTLNPLNADEIDGLCERLNCEPNDAPDLDARRMLQRLAENKASKRHPA